MQNQSHGRFEDGTITISCGNLSFEQGRPIRSANLNGVYRSLQEAVHPCRVQSENPNADQIARQTEELETPIKLRDELLHELGRDISLQDRR
jgi:hypothetical protein